ncbi:MAG: hypothetical protein V7K68_08295 [Nostoc sp.]|uniref:hypothetical protein n=1 Tax=Nostoc sp. TaxID=1180 RepID=UPI002FFB1694
MQTRCGLAYLFMYRFLVTINTQVIPLSRNINLWYTATLIPARSLLLKKRLVESW